ncbi:hypothetical protein KP77_32190 [Jeotgalibacillus alimentarius]|uniref:Uncharacterized protein n=1 Tax=Jeotgalibacillus alimentarius TaxID=135826 RepID=A0A0C2VHQ9_9BACL|nr:hypothetical protein [Jeotgalibacillus alimentarius]KIL43513.1 hypothetical protein KP77_32190 [Jeotgalibacillus alimentarius]
MKVAGYFLSGLAIATLIFMIAGPIVGGVIAFALLFTVQMSKGAEEQAPKDRVAEAYQKYLDEKETGA